MAGWLVTVQQKQLESKVVGALAHYELSSRVDRRVERVKMAFEERQKESLAEQARADASACYIVGGVGGGLVTTGLGAVLATTASVTGAMVFATGVGGVVVVAGTLLGYGLSRRARRLQSEQRTRTILLREMDKIDQEVQERI